MLKKTLTMAVAGTTAAAGIFLVPGLVAGTTPLALAACGTVPPGTYATCSATTTDAGATPLIQYGQSVTVTATVSSNVPQPDGQAPTGEVSFAISTTSPGCTAPSGGSGALTPVTTTGATRTSTADFTFPNTAGATCTYDVVASYAGNATYGASSDSTVHVTVNPAQTTMSTPTVVRSSNDRQLSGTFTVSSPHAGAPASPTPTVTCGSVTGSVTYTTGNGQATYTCTIAAPSKFSAGTTVTASFAGNSNYAPASAQATG